MGRQGGFTLLEMIVVIVLAAVALSLVSFSLSRGLDGLRAREAGRDLSLALRMARARAISDGEPTRVEFDMAGRRYQAPGQPAHALPPRMTLRLTTAAALHMGERGSIQFYPDGSSTGGNVLVEGDGRAWRVNVAWLTGDVRWQEVRP